MMNLSPAPTANDLGLCANYYNNFIDTPENFPITYTYAGQIYTGMPADSEINKRFLDSSMIETVIKGNISDELEVRIESITYRDYPVIEWTVYFKCLKNEQTEILENVYAVKQFFKGENAVLTHNNGDFYHETSYTVTRLPLNENVVFTQNPQGGRACDKAYPYQRLLFDGYGVNISIGWPGQWKCEYKGVSGGVEFKAGQETVHTVIKKGEVFRTPRMTFMFFEGDEVRGINVWRRWFNAHVTPYHRGKIIQPKLPACENGGGIEFTKADVKNQLDGIRFIKENLPNANLWWIDAGWYPCINKNGDPEWPITGSWYPDPVRFPDGLKPIGEACKEAGLELLVWFEPERVRKETWIAENHPEWLLKVNNNDDTYMLNLTNPECHKWLRETISELIKESGIVCYRQDCNFELLYYWRDNESENRKGMCENQYIQAYLSFWDYLLMNNRDLWIDSCASGGRRNDMETMRRAVPLHPTDYGYGYHHVNQAYRHTLHSWFPYTRGWSDSWDKDNDYFNHSDYYMVVEPTMDNYTIINSFGSLTFCGSASGIKKLESHIPCMRKLYDIWEKFSQIQLYGDFYALTENHRDFTKWTIFQFDRPERDDGAFQVLRNNQSEKESVNVKPYGFKEDFEYRFYNEETNESFVKKGIDIIADGITLTQPKRSGAIWFYNKIS